MRPPAFAALSMSNYEDPAVFFAACNGRSNHCGPTDRFFKEVLLERRALSLVVTRRLQVYEELVALTGIEPG